MVSNRKGILESDEKTKKTGSGVKRTTDGQLAASRFNRVGPREAQIAGGRRAHGAARGFRHGSHARCIRAGRG